MNTSDYSVNNTWFRFYTWYLTLLDVLTTTGVSHKTTVVFVKTFVLQSKLRRETFYNFTSERLFQSNGLQ